MKDKNMIAVDTYNKIAQEYDKEFGNDYSDTPYVDKFLNYLEGKKVLDIGCGVGNLTKYIMDKGFNVEGIDLSKEMLNIAKQKYSDIKFYEMNMKEITLRKKYDGIMLAYSLFHLTKKEVIEVLPKYYDLLNSNGKILLILQYGQGERIVNEPLKEGLKIFINYYSQDEIIEILKNNRFKILYTDLKKSESEFELGNDKLVIICQKQINGKEEKIQKCMQEYLQQKQILNSKEKL